MFQPGADGKLQPIPGWKTTGPFDAGTWAKNVDWGGVMKDGGKIMAGALSGAGATLTGPLSIAGQAAAAYSLGNDAYDDTKSKFDAEAANSRNRR